MTALVTLAQAKAHLRVDHASDDMDISLKIEAASGAVINYLKEASELFVDSSGEVIMTSDSPPESTVPKVIQQAVLLLLGDFYRNRESKTDDPISAWFGTLPRAVTALLYSYRNPTVQ